MVVAASRGLRRALGSSTGAASGFLMAFGISMLAAAVFKADPVDGFPVGTPLGPPTSISTTGVLHFVAGAIGFTAFGVSALLFARALSRLQRSTLARMSLVCGVIMLVAFYGGVAFSASSSGIAGIWVSVVTGWAWLAVLCVELTKHAPPGQADRAIAAAD